MPSQNLRRETIFTPYVIVSYSIYYTTRAVWGVGDIEQRGSEDMDEDVRYLSIAVLRNFRQIVCKNTIYTFEDAELLDFPALRAHGTGLL